MRTFLSTLIVAVLLACSVEARADSCYSNSQCGAGYICWGGQCELGGSNGQAPSSSANGGGGVNPVAFVLGLVVIVGLIYVISVHTTADAAARVTPAQNAIPPEG